MQSSAGAGFRMIRSRCRITLRPVRFSLIAHLADAIGIVALSVRKKRKEIATNRFHPKRRPAKRANYAQGSPGAPSFSGQRNKSGPFEQTLGKPAGAPWYGFVRVTRRLADEDFCRALKLSGCVMLKLGLESGDQGVLTRGQRDRPCRCFQGAGLTQKQA